MVSAPKQPSAARSRNMAAIRRRDTQPELALRKALRARGLVGYRCDCAHLPGRPDVAFTKYRVAVFVDGGFWHGHPKRWKAGRYGSYWDEKIERNVQRDREADAKLRSFGWAVVRLWDFEMGKNMDAAVKTVEAALAAHAGRALAIQSA
jgi:DNA mismatch endonuclease (patch repair protein)